MTIDEAIKLLEGYSSTGFTGKMVPFGQAVKLGTEALKQVKESRFDPSTWEPRLLPGETKE